jgi:hypothetical protein
VLAYRRRVWVADPGQDVRWGVLDDVVPAAGRSELLLSAIALDFCGFVVEMRPGRVLHVELELVSMPDDEEPGA